MTLRPTQAEFGTALRAVELTTVVYKPPDDARNWKPCDFMVWVAGAPPTSAWFEVKDVDAVNSFPIAGLRPSQMQGIADATRVGFPYWLAIWWRRQREWTISDAVRVLAWRDDNADDGVSPGWKPTSIPRELLISRFGISSTKQQLTGTLKAVLLGEVD
jgi:hypothetical protein